MLEAIKKKNKLRPMKKKTTYLLFILGKTFEIKSCRISPTKPEFPLSINQKELLNVI